MGAYINPATTTKENWLTENGDRIMGPPLWDAIPEGKLAVCLVDNGPFRAAAIAFCPMELLDFAEPRDTRPKKWYLVDEAKLHTVSSELATYQKVYEERRR